MNAPQGIVLFLIGLSVFLNLIKHGEKKQSEWNFHTSLISAAILLGLLYWGGFFGA